MVLQFVTFADLTGLMEAFEVKMLCGMQEASTVASLEPIRTRRNYFVEATARLTVESLTKLSSLLRLRTAWVYNCILFLSFHFRCSDYSHQTQAKT